MNPADFQLAGRHAVITGGGTGIGAATAARLAELGLRITVMGRRREPLEVTCRDLPQAQAICADISDEAAVQRAFAEASGKFGPVAVLVNNAGSAATAPFAKITLEQWQRMLSVNLTGSFLCSREVLAGMRGLGWGRIINIASTAGLKGYGYVAGYCAAKHGVIGMTRALALETAREGITVNAVCPGYTETDLVETALTTITEKTGRSREQALAEFTKHNPQQRLVQPAEVAEVVSWLCLPRAAALTGQAVPVACGEIM
jgi:NAD(P)-dependent dehydrogenase (short-subunit alcohol dehydrogenase family)